jgi:hypothetical protein
MLSLHILLECPLLSCVQLVPQLASWSIYTTGWESLSLHAITTKDGSPERNLPLAAMVVRHYEHFIRFSLEFHNSSAASLL